MISPAVSGGSLSIRFISSRPWATSSSGLSLGTRALSAIEVATPPGWTTVTPTVVSVSSWLKLAGRVSGLTRRGDKPVNARQVDDPGIIAGLQHGQERTSQSHHAPEVDRKQPLKILFAHLLERAAQRHTGIVDEQIDAGMRLCDSRWKGCDRRRIGHVEKVAGDAHPVAAAICAVSASPVSFTS